MEEEGMVTQSVRKLEIGVVFIFLQIHAIVRLLLVINALQVR
jgi:hypothetical protein